MADPAGVEDVIAVHGPTAQAVEKAQSEVYLRVQIAEQTTHWIHRFGGRRTLTAMREWLDYMDRQAEISARIDGQEAHDG